MSISLRAAALRAALERALGAPAQMAPTPRGLRVHAPAPPSSDNSTWMKVISALQSADRWGSTDAADQPEVWAEVDEVST